MNKTSPSGNDAAAVQEEISEARRKANDLEVRLKSEKKSLSKLFTQTSVLVGELLVGDFSDFHPLDDSDDGRDKFMARFNEQEGLVMQRLKAALELVEECNSLLQSFGCEKLEISPLTKEFCSQFSADKPGFMELPDVTDLSDFLGWNDEAIEMLADILHRLRVGQIMIRHSLSRLAQIK